MANLQLQDQQKIPYSLTGVDKDGLPAQLAAGATVAVSSSDPTLATVVADATPAAGSIASGFIVAQPKLGTVQINAAVTNADGSAGITGAVSIDIVSGPAASIAFGLGTPVAQ
jgi:hypothetical protein